MLKGQPSIGSALLLSLQPETRSFYDRVFGQQSSVSATAILAVDAFIAGCKADGIWNLLLDVGVFVGDNLTAALTKLKHVGTFTNLVATGVVEANYSQATGLALATGRSLDTQFNPSVHLAQNISASAHFYSRSAAAAASTTADMFAVDASDNSTALYIRYPSTVNIIEYDCYADASYSAGFASSSNTNTLGLFGGCRTSASVLAIYRNGVPFTLTTNQATSPVTRTNGSYKLQGNKTCSFYALGLAFTAAQETSLYNRVQPLQTALGRNV